MAFVSLATGSTSPTAVALLKNGRRCPERAPLISRRRLELSSATSAPWSATTIEIRLPLGNPERNGNEPCGERLEELLGELERR